MKIIRSAAIAVFAAIGFQSASNWTNDKLAAKLNRLPETEGLNEIKDKDARVTIKAVLADIEAGNQITVVDEGASDEPAAPAKKKKAAPVEETPAEVPAKKKKVVPAEEPPAPAPEKVIERDVLGAKVGSKASAVNACIIDAGGWANEDDIVTKTGFTHDFVKVHLSFLFSQKKIEKQVLRQFRLPAEIAAPDVAPDVASAPAKKKKKK